MRALIALDATVAVAAAGAPLSKAPERGHSERLVVRAKRGDRDARRLLVEEHMGLVRSVAMRYGNHGLPAEDLTQEGAIGLLQAIDDFDPGWGTRFSTYAYWRVRSAVTHALTTRGRLVRIPRPVLERRHRMLEKWRELAADGHEPSAQELAAAMQLPTGVILDTLATLIAVESLDAPLADGTPHSALVDENAAEPISQILAHERRGAVTDAVGRLDTRKREIVTRHFGLGRKPETLAEIAADLDLSPARTRTLKDSALYELGTHLQPVLGMAAA